MEFLKVSSKSSPASVAGAIAGMVKDGVPVNMQCVGAGAVNQAIKAMAIARGFLIPPVPPFSPTSSSTVNPARPSGSPCMCITSRSPTPTRSISPTIVSRFAHD